MIKPTEQRVALPRLSLAAQAWGDPDAPPLLALHGWLDNAASFGRLAPLLAARFRVVALELPGHGHSDHRPPGSAYHFIDYVSIVLQAAAALGLDRYHLLGHSLGAGIASLVAAAAPQRIAALALIEGIGPLGDDGSRTLARLRESAAAPWPAARSLRVFNRVELAVRARCLASGMAPELARPIVERSLLEVDGGWQWRSDSALTRTSPARLAESQIHALLRGIEAPTTLLLAEPETPYLPAELMQRRIDCVPQITVSRMAGGHHLHLEHPAAVADWIFAAAGTSRL